MSSTTRRLAKTHVGIWIVAFAMDGAVGIEMLALPLLAIKLGASAQQLGIIGAVRSLAYAAVCPLTGHIADRVGYRRMMVTSCAATSVGYLFLAGAPSVTRILIITPFIGLSMSMFWPSFQAWFSKGQSRAALLRLMGSFNIAWGVSHLVGPLAAGALFASDPKLPFYTSLAIVVAVGVFLATRFQIASTGIPPSDREYLKSPRDRKAYLYIAWIANFVAFFATGVVRYIFPKMAIDAGIGAETLGVLLSLIALTQTAVFIIASLTDRWQYRIWPLFAGQGMVLAGVLLLGYGNSPLVYGIGLSLLGGLCGIAFCCSFFYSLFDHARGGARAGIHEGILGSGFLFGPLLGGLAAQHLGRSAPYILCAVLLLAGTCVQAFLLHSARQFRKKTKS